MARATRGSKYRRKVALLAGILLVAVLGILVALQVGWLDELASSQRTETKRVLRASADRFASDLQGALASIEESIIATPGGFDATSSPLVSEVVALRAGEEPERKEPTFIAAAPDGQRWLVVLDAAQLREKLFPALAAKAFGEDGLATYRVSVVSTDGARTSLYSSRSEPSHADQPADLSRELHLLPNRWKGFLGEGESSWTSIDTPVFVLADGEKAQKVVELRAAAWRLELRHVAGSIELALEQARRRNLLLGGGMLALLVSGLAFLWTAETRARRLAEKELAFVAGVSHELRTPLTVVRTAASNLRRGVVVSKEQTEEYGELIETEIGRVSALVERVLRFSRERTALDLRENETETLIQSAIARCEPWRDRKRFHVSVEVARDARTIYCDGPALISALHNLIENAIKYGGPDHEIRVRAWREKGLFIEVSDNGPGISRQDRARLFEPFYRGKDIAEKIPGSGLGLAVARDIAMAHGGRLELLVDPERSSRNAGATFSLQLPPRASGEST